MTFTLDHRLESSSRFVADLPLCQLRLKTDDATYPWVYLIPRKMGVREIFDLDEAGRRQLVEETAAVGAVLQKLFAADKINTAALGNMVPQLHVHVFARHTTDPAWPKPVWAVQTPEIPYTEDEENKRISLLQQALAPKDATK